MATYCAGKKCTHRLIFFIGAVLIEKSYVDEKKMQDWIDKYAATYKEEHPDIKDKKEIEYAAIEAYSKITMNGNKYKPITNFRNNFYKAFSHLLGERVPVYVEMDNNIWKIVKGKDNAGEKATEADKEEFEAKKAAYTENPVKFIKDNFKLKK